MSLMQVIRSGAPTDPVTLPAIDLSNFLESGKCWSGIRFGSDGTVYRQSATGSWQAAGTWLFSGNASDYYLSRTIDSGTLNETDAGAGPLQMNSNRDYNISRSSNGTKSTTVSFEISSDVSGTPVVASRTYTPFADVGVL